MLTKDEAIKIARELNPKVNYCREMDDAFIFSVKEDNVLGGNEPVAVLKENGQSIAISNYNCMAGVPVFIDEYEV